MERCFIVGSCSGCAGCPLKPKRQEDANCIDKLVTNTIDLINRQQKQIDVLNTNCMSMCQSMPNMAKAERAEAIKEFAEKLKDRKTSYYDDDGWLEEYVRLETIDNLVKEMVGADNG